MHKQAHKQRRYYPDYAFVSIGVDVDGLLLNPQDLDIQNCTVDNVQTVLNYSLAIKLPIAQNTVGSMVRNLNCTMIV